jgi:hypothetical protein
MWIWMSMDCIYLTMYGKQLQVEYSAPWYIVALYIYIYVIYMWWCCTYIYLWRVLVTRVYQMHICSIYTLWVVVGKWVIVNIIKVGVRGYPSIFLLPLSSPTLPYSPLVHMYLPHTSSPSIGPTLKGWQLSHSQSDDPPEVGPPIVDDFLHPPLLVTWQHRTGLGHIGTGLCDTMAPSAITWASRLGTRRLGTVSLCTLLVDWPSQRSLECSLWISLG